MVRRAQGSKAPIQRLADRVSEVFVPIVLGARPLPTFVVWMLVGPEPRLTLGADRVHQRRRHRLPVRHGPGHADRDHGRDGPRRRGRDPHPRRGRARDRGRDRHRRLRQDRDADRSAGRRSSTSTPAPGVDADRAARPGGLGRAWQRAPDRRRDPGCRPASASSASGPVSGFVAQPGSGVEGVVEADPGPAGSRRRRVIVGTDTPAARSAGSTSAGRERPGRGDGAPGGPPVLVAIDGRPAGSSRSPIPSGPRPPRRSGR